MISIIVAMGKNNEIGLNNEMPWHLPNDLRYFKNITTGHTIVMGRKTYESIGRPLPNRKNVILSRQSLELPESVSQIQDINDIKKLAQSNEQIFILGGAEVYRQTIDLADELFITQINESFTADTYFPQVNLLEWQQVSAEQGLRDEKNDYDYKFLRFTRK